MEKILQKLCSTWDSNPGYWIERCPCYLHTRKHLFGWRWNLLNLCNNKMTSPSKYTSNPIGIIQTFKNLTNFDWAWNSFCWIRLARSILVMFVTWLRISNRGQKKWVKLCSFIKNKNSSHLLFKLTTNLYPNENPNN